MCIRDSSIISRLMRFSPRNGVPRMRIRSIAGIGLLIGVAVAHVALAQDKKVERIRVGGGSTSATQMSLWLAKEGNLYEKHGLSVEAISIPAVSYTHLTLPTSDLV